MGTPVDMGFRHEGNAFGDHFRTCRHCRRGGHPALCDSYQALTRDFERRRDRSPTVEVQPLSSAQLVAQDPEGIYGRAGQ